MHCVVHSLQYLHILIILLSFQSLFTVPYLRDCCARKHNQTKRYDKRHNFEILLEIRGGKEETKFKLRFLDFPLIKGHDKLNRTRFINSFLTLREKSIRNVRVIEHVNVQLMSTPQN